MPYRRLKMKRKFQQSKTDTFWDVLFIGMVVGMLTVTLYIISEDTHSQGGSRYEHRYE